ncbi:MAG: DNA repair protein RecO C-terminal domain-containing protein [Prevotella sp.]|uniref:DNA repair protein RecO n=1 Tax=Prevotella sp. TaxID=59823 RepID=UPI002A2A0D5A|nr:DNA repair protein RecO C-terminal domain-containing protein [Prevotella sp.]MDD7318572.1 DNA repair protein RecO C-terminal domain-containing protein [Prevotellaceae bacterium]MDY4020373.1 DNA repair protein RecO C-terminal domain-containing protein [Prevotella sp.]
MIVKTRAIVLHTLKYGERKMIVELLCRETGRTACIVGVPKTPRGRVQKQAFQPLTMLEAELDIRHNVQLQHIRDLRMSLPFSSIPFSAEKMSIALFLSEFLYHATRGEQCNESLFDYVENSITWLDGCEPPFANFHLVFMMRMARFIGFYPNVEDYREGDFFDLRDAMFVCEAPLHRDYLSASDAQRLSQLVRMDYNTMRLFRMSHTDRDRIAEGIVRYYRLHVAGFPELRSLAVLKELWR